jgi:hypothetical protein
MLVFNYVAQPEDGVKDLYPRIAWVWYLGCKWAYQTLDGQPPKMINSWTSSLLVNMRRIRNLVCGTESNHLRLRTQSECLGDNNMLASDYGIKTWKNLANLTEWTRKEAQDYDNMLTRGHGSC